MYNSGSIDIVVRYNKIVTVTGTPRLKLNSGDSVYATYKSGSDFKELLFTYELEAGHNADPLDYENVNSLELNGGAIKDKATNATAGIELPSAGAPIHSQQKG